MQVHYLWRVSNGNPLQWAKVHLWFPSPYCCTKGWHNPSINKIQAKKKDKPYKHSNVLKKNAFGVGILRCCLNCTYTRQFCCLSGARLRVPLHTNVWHIRACKFYSTGHISQSDLFENISARVLTEDVDWSKVDSSWPASCRRHGGWLGTFPLFRSR